jgi:hypothetical protein
MSDQELTIVEYPVCDTIEGLLILYPDLRYRVDTSWDYPISQSTDTNRDKCLLYTQCIYAEGTDAYDGYRQTSHSESFEQAVSEFLAWLQDDASIHKYMAHHHVIGDMYKQEIAQLQSEPEDKI